MIILPIDRIKTAWLRRVAIVGVLAFAPILMFVAAAIEGIVQFWTDDVRSLWSDAARIW